MPPLLQTFCLGSVLIASASAAPCADELVELSWRDAARERTLPLRVHVPDAERAPLVVFSTDTGEAAEAYDYLGTHWAQAGFLVVVVEHPGFESKGPTDARTLGTPLPPLEVYERHVDLHFVLNRLLTDDTEPLRERVEGATVALAGHGTGSTTALSLSGLSLRLPGARGPLLQHAAVGATLALSPEVPCERGGGGRIGLRQTSWSGLEAGLPLMVCAASLDYEWVPELRRAPSLRLAGYERAPNRIKHLVDLIGGGHAAFTGGELWYEAPPRRDVHHEIVQTASTDFLRATLQGNRQAAQQLRRGVLESAWRGEVRQLGGYDQRGLLAGDLPRSFAPIRKLDADSRRIRGAFSALDLDRDRTLTLQELPARYTHLFDELDANQDGSIGRGEWTTRMMTLERSLAPVQPADPKSDVWTGPEQAPDAPAPEAPEVTEPLAPPEGFKVPVPGAPRDLDGGAVGDLHDVQVVAADGRSLRLRVLYPMAQGPFPLVVFSHGRGQTRLEHEALLTAWARAGFVVLVPDHADSPLRTRVLPRRGAPLEERAAEVRLALDALPSLIRAHPSLEGRVDEERIGVAGFSQGADTAQVLAGVRPFLRGEPLDLSDPRVDAVIALSTEGPSGALRHESWETYSVPTLWISGSRDGPTRAGRPSTWRRRPFELGPPGARYSAWIQGLDHGFGDLAGNGKWADAPQLRALIERATVAFWAGTLGGEPEALEELARWADASREADSLTFESR